MPLKLWSGGTGSEVDAIPVFDESGVNTEVIFDDPRLKNTEFDHIDDRMELVRVLWKGRGLGWPQRASEILVKKYHTTQVFLTQIKS